MSILKYFTQEARDARTCKSDNKRREILSARAEKAINTKYIGNGIWITVDGVPILRITNESEINKFTIAISEVELFIKELREKWVTAHIHDRLDMHA